MSIPSRIMLSHARHLSSSAGVTQKLFEMTKSMTDGAPMRPLAHLNSGVQSVKVEQLGGSILQVQPSVLQELTKVAFLDVAHLLRPGHLQQLSKILDDPDASENDRYIALELLKNANIAAGRVLPGCQDTGTAIVMGKKGQMVFTDQRDEESISQGVFDAYHEGNLRYSQMAPTTMFDEKNTKTNLPAQIELYSTPGGNYEFLFIAKGGGSANKSMLYQQTKALLNEKGLVKFLEDNIKTIGTAACPPYHLAIVIGGLSAEQTLKTVKLASVKYLDNLPTSGNDFGRAFRDLQWEQRILKMCQEMGIGAQFGGKYFCHDVRVIRLPRHGASCPVGILFDRVISAFDLISNQGSGCLVRQTVKS
eukprot:GHVN01053921.1.p2 GENE.GHVN01053921.1~~GHVN01053921.1.p2  ORF type:complete len:378 (-),score=40.54 GHVN01053921.1:3122-4210(-)